MNSKVLIVGTGPVGLVTALALNRLGLKPDIIDKKTGPGEQSRVMAVVPGTVEHYCQLGIAEGFLEKAIVPKRFHLRTRHVNARLPFKNIGQLVSRFNSPYIYPQDEHEKYLLKHFSQNDLEVNWENKLISLENVKDNVLVKIEKAGELVETTYDYVIGCDGGSSTVRKNMNDSFSGETNVKLFYVSDVSLEGDYNPEEVEINFLGSDFLLNFPLRGKKIRRLIGIIPEHYTMMVR